MKVWVVMHWNDCAMCYQILRILSKPPVDEEYKGADFNIEEHELELI